MLTTLEECSEGEAGGWRTAWRVGLPPFSMFRWDSDSVRSDSPPSEDRNAFSGGPARLSMLPSGWYLETQTHQLCALHYSSKNDMFCLIGFLNATCEHPLQTTFLVKQLRPITLDWTREEILCLCLLWLWWWVTSVQPAEVYRESRV